MIFWNDNIVGKLPMNPNGILLVFIRFNNCLNLHLLIMYWLNGACYENRKEILF